MEKKVLRKAQYCGMALIVPHTAFVFYSFYLVMVTYAGDGQGPMVLIPLWLIDLPITVIMFSIVLPLSSILSPISTPWLALLWQKCDFWDSLFCGCVIHEEPALMEAGDGCGLAGGSRALA